MQLLQNFTLAQLRAATKAQIITAITNRLSNMTKREIVLWLMENVDRESDAPVITRRADGQIESQTEVGRDVETGAAVSNRVTQWSYYPNGDVDTINVATAQSGIVTTKIIKHYQDGRQPTMSVELTDAQEAMASTPESGILQQVWTWIRRWFGFWH